METKQTIETEQQDTETKQTAQSKQPEKISIPIDSTEKSRIYYLIVLSIGTVIISISNIFILTPRINTTLRTMLRFTNEGIIKAESQETSEVEGAGKKIEQDPSASIMDKAITEAYKLQRVGKINEAIEKWRAIATVAEGVDDDFAVNVWFTIGHLHRIAGRTGQALSAYDRVIQLNPDNVTAYSNRGTVKSDLGQYEAAIADLNRALLIQPNDAKAYNNRGTTKLALGQYKAAITDFDEAIRINPDYTDAYNNRGTAKLALGQYEAAIADLNRALLIQPNDAKAYNNRGTAELALGQYKAAIADLNRALLIQPNDAKAYNNRGTAKFALEQYKAAITDFDEAIRLNPGYATAYVKRGRTNQRLGNIEVAKVDFQTALEFSESNGSENMKTTAKQYLQELNSTK